MLPRARPLGPARTIPCGRGSPFYLGNAGQIGKPAFLSPWEIYLPTPRVIWNSLGRCQLSTVLINNVSVIQRNGIFFDLR